MLWLTKFSHGVNHFQNEMVAVLYVVVMPVLEFIYTQLGALTAIRSVFGGALHRPRGPLQHSTSGGTEGAGPLDL